MKANSSDAVEDDWRKNGDAYNYLTVAGGDGKLWGVALSRRKGADAAASPIVQTLRA